MVPGSRMFLCALVIAGAVIGSFVLSQTPEPEGRVTNIFHDVQLLPAQADARAAAINDKVDEGTALRTGGDSRSELTFADLTITRLGENTIYTFNRAGRSVRLDSGSILLYARKNSGGAEVSTKAVTVGITGTTLIFESRPDSYDRLIVLEGDARFSLNNYPDQSTEVHAGQLLHVRAGSKKLPKPGRVDLRRIIKTHPLIKNFPPLPSLDLILAAADGRNPNRPPPQPQPPISGTGSQGGPPPVYVPNPSGPPPGPPTGTRYPVNPVPTPTPRHRPSPKPYPTVKSTTPRPTPHRPWPKPTPTAKKRYPPIKHRTPTPTPGQIIR
jgi:mannose-6-phosphate isomerase-like protein (cupin superfamily)